MSRIEVRDLWKRYRRPHQRVSTLKEALLAFFRGQTGYEEFWALRSISFTVEPGEVVGVVGPNGSGKSTLLAILARVLVPTRGTVRVEGRVCPMLELGTGFHPDLTGRENVYLNASLLGLNRRETRDRYGAIVEFAELAEFMEAPVKTYSSGMVVRLGFSVAVHLDPDVLLIDEVLGVGDEHFQHKSFERLMEFKQQGKTILVVSHELNAIGRFCERAIWLDHGHMMMDSTSDQVVQKYRSAVEEVERAAAQAKAPHAHPV